MSLDVNENSEYNNMIKWLKKQGEKSLSECSLSLNDYSRIVKDLCIKYGEDKVKSDLGIK